MMQHARSAFLYYIEIEAGDSRLPNSRNLRFAFRIYEYIIHLYFNHESDKIVHETTILLVMIIIDSYGLKRK